MTMTLGNQSLVLMGRISSWHRFLLLEIDAKNAQARHPPIGSESMMREKLLMESGSAKDIMLAPNTSSQSILHYPAH